MNLEQWAMLLGLAMGAVGGMLAGLSVMFSGFTSVAGVPSSNSKRQRTNRTAFFLTRIAFGAGLGFWVTFWFMDSFLAGSISTSKLAFVQAVTGYASSMLKAFTGKARSLFA